MGRDLRNKKIEQFSWYQPEPTLSLDIIESLNLAKTAKIIDVGGGDSYLVDNLLKQGYQNITVLDISEKAIERTKKRLGKEADKVRTIVTDITEFHPIEAYDFWHDRAVLHFLTSEKEIEQYVQIMEKGLSPGAFALIGTFSDNGPKECSGIRVTQYSEETMTQLLARSFTKLGCRTLDHKTPSGSIQNFLFCSFRKQTKRPQL